MQTRAGNTERYCLHALANAGALILTEVDLARYCPHVSMRHFPDEHGRPNPPSCRSQRVGIK